MDDVKIDENSEGVTIASNGSFKIAKTLDASEAYREHLITVTDKAGNVSQMTVYAVRADGFTFNNLELYLDGKEIAKDSAGDKTVNLKNGQSAKLSVYALTPKGQKFELENDMIDWSVLYDKNAVELKDGTVCALSPGETAVKAKLATANAKTANGTRSEGISDYTVINIANNSRSDLVDKITEARTVLANNPSASEDKKNALNDAIAEAEKLVNNPEATESDFTNGVTKLTQAIDDFQRKDESRGGIRGSRSRYNISVIETEHGKVEISQDKVYSGNSVTITAIPDEGYAVSDMLINGKSVGRETVYTISAVRSNIEVKVIFGEKSDLPFIDVLKSDWFYPYVKSAYENKFMLGTSQDRFSPRMSITRGMFVTLLYRIDGEKAEGENVFSDVAEDAYYKNAVAWASANGIVKGVTETKFDPDKSITREQIAALLYRYAQYKGYDVSVGENTNILSYTDAQSVSEYAIPAVQYAVGAELMQGKSETTLNPKDDATRAEAATIIDRFLKK